MRFVKHLVNILKNNYKWVIIILLSAVIIYQHLNPKVVEKVVEKPVIQEVIHKEVITEVQALHKENEQDADLVVNTKDSIKVSVNGKQFDLKPQNSEKFEFGKDYVKLDQQSNYTLSINNKPLEPSWGVGVGITSNKRAAGLFTVRVKKSPLQFWGMTDGKTHAGGIMIMANYK